ncbi:MAG: SDR family oxidoreductase, partial [Acidobacteriaceae bacterium]|nr:SDR family oxidoreductase [Acidobacteriaceae bacterium]
MQPLQNKIALVVGASRGIGLAIARDIARNGARTILASRDLSTLENEAAALRSQDLDATALRLDVSDPQTFANLPEVDILVNVAGTNIRKPIEQYSNDEIARLLQTNLLGLFEITRRVGRGMIERGSAGKIIFIGSLMSLLGLPYLSI